MGKLNTLFAGYLDQFQICVSYKDTGASGACDATGYHGSVFFWKLKGPSHSPEWGKRGISSPYRPMAKPKNQGMVGDFFRACSRPNLIKYRRFPSVREDSRFQMQADATRKD